MKHYDSDSIEKAIYDQENFIKNTIKKTDFTKLIFESSLKLAELYWKKSGNAKSEELLLSHNYLEFSNMIETYTTNKAEDALLGSSIFLDDDINQMNEQKNIYRSKISEIISKINYTPKNKATFWNEIESYYNNKIRKNDMI